jgi:hypothetical protein
MGVVEVEDVQPHSTVVRILSGNLRGTRAALKAVRD